MTNNVDPDQSNKHSSSPFLLSVKWDGLFIFVYLVSLMKPCSIGFLWVLQNWPTCHIISLVNMRGMFSYCKIIVAGQPVGQ